MEPIKLTRPKFSLTSSNYYDGEIESLNTMRVSTNTNWGSTFSTDVGIATDFNKVKPAVEVKYAQKLGSTKVLEQDINFKGYSRYRHIGDTNQLRLAAGVSVPINDKLSFSTDAHYTTKFESGKDKAGFYVSIDYKANKHLSLWADPIQLNFNLDGTGKCTRLHNAGIKYTF